MLKANLYLLNFYLSIFKTYFVDGISFQNLVDPIDNQLQIKFI
jgi:hypothetical protein